MARVLTDDKHYKNIAKGLRGGDLVNTTYTPAEMSEAVSHLAITNAKIIDRTITELVPEDFALVRTIGNRTFMDCANLTSVEIGEQVKTIGKYAFADCPALANVVIPDNVTLIDGYAFNGHGDMVVKIGSGVTEIGTRAFYTSGECHLEMHMKATTPPTLASGALGTVAGLTYSIIVPTGCGEAYKTATNWSKYADDITEETE